MGQFVVSGWSPDVQPGEVTYVTVEDREAAELAANAAVVAQGAAEASVAEAEAAQTAAELAAAAAAAAADQATAPTDEMVATLVTSDSETYDAMYGQFVSSVVVAGAFIDPTGVVGSTAAIQALISAAPNGSTIRFPDGAVFSISDSLLVDHALTLEGRAQIVQTGTGKCGFEVTSSGVAFRGLRITGRQFAATVANEHGIWAHGASSAAYIKNLTIENCVIDNWGQGGVWANFVDGVSIRNTSLEDLRSAGLMFLSCKNGIVDKNTINTVTAAQGYGIALTRYEPGVLAVNPPTSDFKVTNNTVWHVDTWEGIDTHAGERIVIAQNFIYACSVAIAVVGTTSDDGIHAAHDISVANNTMDSFVTDGTAGPGIMFVGASSGIGVLVDGATGYIRGNTVKNHGTDTAGSGGILFYDTRGVAVEGNFIVDCAPNGICAYHDNYNYSIKNNTIVDAWSVTQARADAVRVRSTYNTGTVDGTITMRGAKVALHVMDVGLEIQNTDPSNVIARGANDWSGVVLAELDSVSNYKLDAAKVTVGRSGRQIGFYGVTPVARAAVAAAATDAATTQALANDLRAKLIALGLIS